MIPAFDNIDFTTEYGLPPDPSFIGCHELTHYVHSQQIGNPWRWINAVFSLCTRRRTQIPIR